MLREATLSPVSNVFRRGSTYYFRTRVPKRLRGVVPRKELWRSLLTTVAGEARLRGLHLLSLTERLWRDLERAMTPSEAKRLVDAWLRARLDEDGDLRDAPEGQTSAAVVFRKMEPWRPDVVVERWDDAQLAERMAASGGKAERLWGVGEYGVRGLNDREIAVRAFLKPHDDANLRNVYQDDAVARPLLKAILLEAGVEVDEGTPGFAAALRMMMKAQFDLSQAVMDRDGVSWRRWSDDDPAQPLVDRITPPAAIPQNASPLPAVAESSGTSLSEAEDAFLLEEVRSGQSDGRIKEFKAAYAMFRGWLERDPDVGEVTPQVAGDYRVALSGMPSSGSTRPEYRDLTQRERFALAAQTGDGRLLSPTTIGSNYITPLRGLFEWVRTTGKVTKNPFADIRAPKAKRATAKRERLVFKEDQLTALFSQPLFVGCAGPRNKPLYRPGTVIVDDWRFWLPLIALFSGARLNELCGLHLADFEEENGVHFFHIREGEPDQRVKSAAGIRRVPIHSELVQLGLLHRVARLRAEEEVRLFPDLRPGARGYLSDLPSKFFADLIDRAVGKEAPVVFHSFRHTFITRMRAARVDPLLRMAIVGHDPGETHEDYGEQDIASLDAEVQKVSYTGLDLRQIHTRS